MKFEEIIKPLKEGRKIRSRKWKPHQYIYLDGQELYAEDGLKHNLCSYDLFLVWDLYEEPIETFDFSEALKIIKSGGAVSRVGMPTLESIQDGSDDKTFYVSHVGDVGMNRDMLTIESIKADDWHEVKK